MLRALLLLFAAMALGHAVQASATVGCWFNITTITLGYEPDNLSDTMAAGSYTLNCFRDPAADPALMTYRMDMVTGTFPSGGWQRVQKDGRYYNYNLYRTASVLDPWGAGATGITGTLNFGASNFASVTGPFFVILPARQALQAAGTYKDFVNIRMTGSGPSAPSAVNTLFVDVIVPGGCALTALPGSVNFVYTSFQAAPAAASTSFALRCTPAQPYTLSLDAFGGTLLGLNYTLGIGPAASGTGTGVVQTYTINGAIAAGQSGTCASASCTGSQTRTLTVTF